MSTTFSPEIEREIAASRCDVLDRTLIEDAIAVVEWAAAYGKPLMDGGRTLLFSPGELHRQCTHFCKRTRSRLNQILELLQKTAVITKGIKEPTRGRPKQIACLHNDFVPGETRSMEEIQRILVARLLGVLGKYEYFPANSTPVAETQVNQESKKIVIKALHNFPLNWNGAMYQISKGQKINDPILVRHLMQYGFPVALADEDITDQICPKCYRRINPETYVRSAKMAYRPVREFLLAVSSAPVLRLTPDMIIDSPTLVSELLRLCTPEQPVVTEARDGIDFFRCECATIFFPDDKLRTKP